MNRSSSAVDQVAQECLNNDHGVQFSQLHEYGAPDDVVETIDSEAGSTIGVPVSLLGVEVRGTTNG